MTTILRKTLRYDELGDAATRDDLSAFIGAISAVLDDDDRCLSYWTTSETAEAATLCVEFIGATDPDALDCIVARVFDTAAW